ncbi:ABC transporter permease [Actinomadura napierensis]|uniref:ABC-2 type transporter transmembrane domain-containing protein n=1 Tax=Actinomadura napierensis TaxID=267854 RepID=A0ABN2ZY58_9ACTN
MSAVTAAPPAMPRASSARAAGTRAALGIAGRNLRTAFTTPSLLLPPIVAPLVFFTAFSGGLSVLAHVPGFAYRNGYLSFEFVFAALQGAVFAGIFSGLTLARDFESGVARRLLVGVRHHRAIVGGYVLTALGRAPVVTVALFLIGLAAGMKVTADPLQLLLLFAISECLAAMGALWACGIALRLRTVQAAPLMQIFAFLTVYLSPVFAPVGLLSPWLRAVARLNPFTALLESGRGLMQGDLVRLGATAAATAGLLLLLYLWAVLGLRRARAAGAS